jgi:HTH-type transcriptional regulator, sugar sensing transcriptional regulator
MIVKEDFLKKLRQAFDLNIYEVKIWTALLSRGIATAGELSDISQVPRSRSYDVLETLEKKNFVIMKLGKPIKYIAVKPEEIIVRMKSNIKERAETRVDSLDNIKKETVFEELQQLYSHGITKIEPNSLAGSLKGRDNVYAHLRSILETAKKSITIVTTEQGLIRKAKRYKNLLAKLHGKGVKIRIVAPVSDAVLKQLHDLKKIAQIKKADSIQGRFTIIDDEQILFMISDDTNVHENYDTGVWVNTPYFTKALHTMFNTSWGEMAPVKLKR